MEENLFQSEMRAYLLKCTKIADSNSIWYHLWKFWRKQSEAYQVRFHWAVCAKDLYPFRLSLYFFFFFFFCKFQFLSDERVTFIVLVSDCCRILDADRHFCHGLALISFDFSYSPYSSMRGSDWDFSFVPLSLQSSWWQYHESYLNQKSDTVSKQWQSLRQQPEPVTTLGHTVFICWLTLPADLKIGFSKNKNKKRSQWFISENDIHLCIYAKVTYWIFFFQKQVQNLISLLGTIVQCWKFMKHVDRNCFFFRSPNWKKIRCCNIIQQIKKFWPKPKKKKKKSRR